jgi:hypothetical protein
MSFFLGRNKKRLIFLLEEFRSSRSDEMTTDASVSGVREELLHVLVLVVLILLGLYGAPEARRPE